MEAKNKTLGKVQSNDTISFRDSDDENVLKDDRTREDDNKSLENIFIDGSDVSSLSSRDLLSPTTIEQSGLANQNNNSTSTLTNPSKNIIDNFKLSSTNNNNSESIEKPETKYEVNKKIIIELETMQSKESEENIIKKENHTSEDGMEHVAVKVLSATEEVVDVNFVEEHGEIPNSNSSKSLLKFFNDTSTMKLPTKNIDEEGKNFFDSFTAGYKDDNVINETNNDPFKNVIDSTHKPISAPSPLTITTPSSDLSNLIDATHNLSKTDTLSNKSVLHLSTIPPTLIQTTSINQTPQTYSINPSCILSTPHSNTSNINRTIPINSNPSNISQTLKISHPPTIPTISTLPINNLNNLIIPTFPPTPSFPTTTLDFPNLPDRSYEAWIPPPSTALVLSTHISSSTTLPMDQLTLPGIVANELLGDPIRDLMIKYCDPSDCAIRQDHGSNGVTQDVNGLTTLIKQGNFQSAIDLTSRLIGAYGQGVGKLNQPSTHTPYSLQLWFCRFGLFHRLQQHNVCQVEWNAFKNLDSADLYYQFHQQKYPGKTGSMVPFEMRVLQAEHERYTGRHQACLGSFYALLAVIHKIQLNLDSGRLEDGDPETEGRGLSLIDRKDSCELWKRREMSVLYCLADCLHQMKDYYNSLKIYKSLLRKDPTRYLDIRNAIGRIYLQAGDVERAERQFRMRSRDSKEVRSQGQVIMNRALIEMAKGGYDEAYKELTKLVNQDVTNITALNNMCVCILYTGKLKEALKKLETIIYTNPQLYLHEILILNLCTLYDLESSKATVKKKNLLRLLAQHKSTSFNPSCLKLT